VWEAGSVANAAAFLSERRILMEAFMAFSALAVVLSLDYADSLPLSNP
jgi:hypothetical protein